MFEIILRYFAFHNHYWGVPHISEKDQGRLVQTCYECGRERRVKIALTGGNGK